MKAALYEKAGRIKLREVERNAPGPGYVLVDTRCAGICGSDLHNYFWHWEPPLDDVEEAFRIAADKSSGAIKVHLVQA